MKPTLDCIDLDATGTLYGLFCERVRRSPDAPAYRYYDSAGEIWTDTSWREMAAHVARWQETFKRERLSPGERVAVMLRNCREWVMFDQAALGLGLVVVPLYTEDRAESIAYILQDSGAKLLLIEGGEHWQKLYKVQDRLGQVERIVTLEAMSGEPHDPRLRWAQDWLADGRYDLAQCNAEPDNLASIVYTSGTTGRPKGVMLSHRNMLWDTWSGLQSIDIYREDLFLSFLPLSHTLERTVGYYLPIMAGACVAYARSVAQLAEDLVTVRPTALISVPRIFERVYNKIQEQLELKSSLARRLFLQAVEVGWQHFLYRQGRRPWSAAFLGKPLLDTLVGHKVLAKLGGRMRLAVCGGAALPPDVARLFIGLGLTLAQGYGLTESSPVISVNKLNHNDPASVGEPLTGLEVQVGDEQELLVRGPNVMLGYWNNTEATAAVIDKDGWLHTGDKVRIEDKRIYITGRLKEIIVMSNGEKIPPVDMEMAIAMDPLIEQVMVLGEGRPYLAALAVLNTGVWPDLAKRHGVAERIEAVDPERLEQILLERIAERLKDFPGYAQVRRVAVCAEPWSIDNGLLTPTMKLRRQPILERYRTELERLYEGH